MSYASGDIGDWRRGTGRFGYRADAKTNSAVLRRAEERVVVRAGLSEYEADEAERWPPRDYHRWFEMDDYDPPESLHPPTAPHCETCCCDLRSTKRDP